MSGSPVQTAPKRVLMTADTVGGVWTYALELARSLCRHGIEVALATMGARVSKEQCEEAASIPNLTLFESTYKLEWYQDPWDEVKHAGEWLADLENQVNPCLIHLNSFAHGGIGWHAPVLMAGHSCVLSWWQAVKGCEAPAEWNTYRDVVTRGLRAADLVVAPSKAMMDCLQHYYGPLHHTAVIPNGRTVPATGSGTKEDFIFSAGRLWDEAKNLFNLAKVAPGLDWPVFVAGDVSNPGETATATHPLSFSSGVVHVGRLSGKEMMDWFQRARIYCMPARYEPFGLTPLEAALNGCALVLGDIPSLREIWGKAALFVPPNDSNALGGALNYLIENPKALDTLTGSAASVAASYGADKMVAKYLSCYSALLNRQKSSNCLKTQPDKDNEKSRNVLSTAQTAERMEVSCAS